MGETKRASRVMKLLSGKDVLCVEGMQLAK